MEYRTYLTEAIEATEKKIPKSWIIADHGEAVRVANYLRGYGYQVKLKKMRSSLLQRIGCGFLISLE